MVWWTNLCGFYAEPKNGRWKGAESLLDKKTINRLLIATRIVMSASAQLDLGTM